MDIKAGALACSRLLRALSAHVEADVTYQQVNSTDLEDEAGRFRVWSSNLGAFGSGHSSLDYRLKDSPLLQQNVLKLLKELQVNLIEAIKVLTGQRLPYELQVRPELGETEDIDDSDESSDEDDAFEEEPPGTELQQRFLEVVDIIDNLYKLSIRIRSPTLRTRSARAVTFRPKDRDTGVDLLAQYAAYDRQFIAEAIDALRRPTVERNNGYEFLIERLSKGITRRRQQFKYWRRHRDKLALSGKDAEILLPVVEEAKRNSQPSPSVITADLNQMKQTFLSPVTINAPTILSGTEATVHYRSLDDEVDARSVTSYATTVRDLGGQVSELPPPPKCATLSKDFECPYCFVICPARYGTSRGWRSHILQDLQPYVCTYEDCSEGDQLFRSRREWAEHEQSHRRLFRCPRHWEAVFRSRSSLEQHLRDQHSGEFPEQQMNILLSAAETSAVDQRQECPICFASAAMDGGLQNHIANHLERFASFSLPRDAEIDSTEDQSGASDHASDGKSTLTSHISHHLSSQDSLSSEEIPTAIDRTPSLPKSTDIQILSKKDDGLLVAVVRLLAWSTYLKWNTKTKQSASVAQDILTLHSALSDSLENVENEHDIEDLQEALAECMTVLTRLQQLVDKHGSLAVDSRELSLLRPKIGSLATAIQSIESKSSGVAVPPSHQLSADKVQCLPDARGEKLQLFQTLASLAVPHTDQGLGPTVQQDQQPPGDQTSPEGGTSTLRPGVSLQIPTVEVNPVPLASDEEVSEPEPISQLLGQLAKDTRALAFIVASLPDLGDSGLRKDFRKGNDRLSRIAELLESIGGRWDDCFPTTAPKDVESGCATVARSLRLTLDTMRKALECVDLSAEPEGSLVSWAWGQIVSKFDLEGSSIWNRFGMYQHQLDEISEHLSDDNYYPLHQPLPSNFTLLLRQDALLREQLLSSKGIGADSTTQPETPALPTFTLPLARIPNLTSLYKLDRFPSAVPFEVPSKQLNDRVFFIFYDITRLQVDAIVNTANRSLVPTRGGSLNDRIHSTAGPELVRESARLGPCDPGDCRVTNAYNLPCKKIVHVVRPHFWQVKNDFKYSLLKSCYTKAMELAVQVGCRSIAFPALSALSAGGYGFSAEEAASYALPTIREFLANDRGSSLDAVVLCLYTMKDEDAYRSLIPKYFPPCEPQSESLADTAGAQVASQRHPIQQQHPAPSTAPPQGRPMDIAKASLWTCCRCHAKPMVNKHCLVCFHARCSRCSDKLQYNQRPKLCIVPIRTSVRRTQMLDNTNTGEGSGRSKDMKGPLDFLRRSISKEGTTESQPTAVSNQTQLDPSEPRAQFLARKALIQNQGLAPDDFPVTYAKVYRGHLSLDTLNFFALKWEVHGHEPDYIVIHGLPPNARDVLFQRNQEIADRIRKAIIHRTLPAGSSRVKLGNTAGRPTPLHIDISHPNVSRQHCEFVLGRYGWSVRDLEGSPGTLLNGSRLVPGFLHPVQTGDMLELGPETSMLSDKGSKEFGLPLLFRVECQMPAEVADPMAEAVARVARYGFKLDSDVATGGPSAG